MQDRLAKQSKNGGEDFLGEKPRENHDVLISFLGFVLGVQGVSPGGCQEGVNNLKNLDLKKWFFDFFLILHFFKRR